MTLKPLKNPPMSSAWRVAGSFPNYGTVWASRNGKLYVKATDGKWFQLVRKASK